MMSLNRFRLKHLRKRHSGASRAAKLLDRPDRLIGLILIGNNAVNILASLVAGQLFSNIFGEAAGVWATTILLTIIMLVFAEVTPKTIAAVHPERIAFPFSRVLKVLMTVLLVPVMAINWVTNALVKMFGIDPTKLDDQNLSSDELRVVVGEAGQLIPDQHQAMLLSILDLEKITVNDIMIPRNEIIGIDLDSPLQELTEIILNTDYTRLPVYQGDINNVIGILHARAMNQLLRNGKEGLSIEGIKRFSSKPYFIPENTKLSMQLVNFQKAKRRFGFVVDEYGEIEGLATLDDLLEEIVGDYTTSETSDHGLIEKLSDNLYRIDGNVSIRDINKETSWNLPIDGPKTLNGLALEQLEELPEGSVSFSIGRYRAEALEISDKVINKLKVWRLQDNTEEEEEA